VYSLFCKIASPNDPKLVTQWKDNKSQNGPEDIVEDTVIRAYIAVGSSLKQLVTSCSDSGLND
jgi:hypothetical protein